MDLFTPIADPSKFHPAFAALKSFPSPGCEAVLRSWVTGFHDRDGKFVHEFQTTFDPCFWELYLHAVLRHVGCEIDFSHVRPDFCVTSPTQFCVEATVALHASGSLPATHSVTPEMPLDLAEFTRQAIIRLANSISTKSRKWLESYSRLLHVREHPFVIAVAPFDRSGFFLQINRAIEAYLFGYYVDESKGTRQELILNGPEVRQIEFVQKDSGSRIPVGIFNDPSHSHISAVIFNTCATWSKLSALSSDTSEKIVFETLHHNPGSRIPLHAKRIKADYEEHLLDGLRIYHNPYADHPLPTALFSDERIFQTFYDGDDWNYQIGPKNLLYRTSIRIVAKGDETAGLMDSDW
jgi:hypothetical protein